MDNQQEIATPKNESFEAQQNEKKKEDQKTKRKERNCLKKSKTVKSKFSTTQRITYFAALVAITFMLKWVSNFLTFGPIRITLSYLGFFISAIIMGPLEGGIIVIIADTLSQFIGGSFGFPHPLIILGNFGGTFLFGIIYKYFPIKKYFLKIFIGTVFFILWATLGFNSLANYRLYYEGTNYISYLLVTRSIQIPIALLNMLITILLIPPMRKIRLID